MTKFMIKKKLKTFMGNTKLLYFELIEFHNFNFRRKIVNNFCIIQNRSFDFCCILWNNYDITEYK